MKYRLDLPLEEQQRLDQIHLNQGGVSPYRNGLNNENSGLNGLFPPKRGERGLENLYDMPNMPKGYREMIEAQRKEEQDLYSSYGKDYMDPSANPRSGGRYTQEFMDYAKNKGYGIRDMTPTDAGMSLTKKDWDVQREKFHPSLGPIRIGQPITQPPYIRDPIAEKPFDLIRDPNDPLPSPPTTMPLPQPPVMPTPSPPKTGGPFGGGGKTFLNRFERLLDGLEGLVGKLGADGSTPESPFSNGGGGLSDAIETPFTPTQDY